MNLEEMQTLWRSQDTRPAFSVNEYVLRYIVEQRRKELSRYFFRELAMAYGSALITLVMCTVLPMMMFFNPEFRTPWDVLLVLSTAFPMLIWMTAVQLAYARRRRMEPSFTSPLREAVERDLQRIDYEISRRTTFRYVFILNGLPLISAVLIGVSSLRWNGNLASQLPWFTPLYIVMFVGGLALIAWTNKRALERKFYPRRRELQELRDKLS